MKQLTSQQIRQLFLDYFVKNGHMIEKGHSLIPHDDPTLLWINSGVAALKKYFDGSIKPASNRITNAQKAIRTNDIENVGKTARHHTFFEMLGNFSIGDYFKKEAIAFAWEFLTSEEWMGLDKNRMYISVHPDDTEAYDIWVNIIGVDPKKISKNEDNFWQIGEGPSGPNSELHYDRGVEYDPENIGERLFFEDLENDRYVELWNVVFSQYDAKEGVDRKDFKELPQKNIDTGMGFERLVSIIQDGKTNFDTDLFLPIIHETEKFTSVKYEEYPMAFRVIADHVRTITFALSDGALFANEGRGYVLRRIIRRAIRFGRKLGIEKSFMYQLVDQVVEIMDSYYPELKEHQELIKKLIKIEEERFHLTLADGEKMLAGLLKDNQLISGEDAFKLYDTYGFPLEMTVEIAAEQGISVDTKGFEKNMQVQKEKSRASRLDEGSMGSQYVDLLNFEVPSQFVGYTEDNCEAEVVGLFVNGEKVQSFEGKGQVVFNQTPFYATSGGQVADTGVLTANSFKGSVIDVIKAPHGQNLHTIEISEGIIQMGDQVALCINKKRRELIRRNHSSVHLLQAALHEIVGTHIHQAGSYVSDEYSRFDFSHYEKIDKETIDQIEKRVNEMISEDSEVITQIMSIEDAKNSGAIALFDEKYGDNVRVVTMGVSKELCGGTHASHTSQLGLYKIISEESVGSGVRRIQAKTSQGAYEVFKDDEKHLNDIATKIQAKSVSKLDEKLEQLLSEQKQYQETIAQLQQTLVSSEIAVLSNQFDESTQALVFKSELDGKLAKQCVEQLANKYQKALIFGAFVFDEKLTFVCASSSEWIAKGIKAGDLVKEAANLSEGGGGGRPNFAQAGGKRLDKVDEIIELIKTKVL